MNTNTTTQEELPIQALPKKIQKMIRGLVQYENYDEDYLLVSILSATASAAGNAVQLRIKGEWVTNSALYIILVGDAGIGKSHPMDFAFKPLRKIDSKYREEYVELLEEYENQTRQRRSSVVIPHPSLKRMLLSDFTPEALMLSHSVNQRGITAMVDEIMGMFGSINQYSKGQLIEQLLTAYSGKSLDVARVSRDLPLHIEHPCISIMGSTQTDRLAELFRNGYLENGLIDRFLFSYPKVQRIPLWDKQAANKSTKIYFNEWENILNKINSLPYDEDTHKWIELSFSVAARDYFYDWHNEAVTLAFKNNIDKRIRGRMMKMHLNVARIALIIQMLRWACDETELTYVDKSSLKSAIMIGKYFDDCYRRIGVYLSLQRLKPWEKGIYEGVGDCFTTADAIKVGEEIGMSKRSVKYLLPILIDYKLIEKLRHGRFRKTINYVDIKQ